MKKAILRKLVKEREEAQELYAVVVEEDKVHVKPVKDGEIIETPVEKIEKPSSSKRKKSDK